MYFCDSQIIDELQAKCKYAIAEVCTAESMGESTTLVVGSDIDVVLFIKGEEPLFDDVLEEFQRVLKECRSCEIRDIQKTKFSIQLKGGPFEFDLLPAAKLMNGNIDIAKQKELVLERIKRDTKKYSNMYSSSLAYSHVEYMKQQDDFVHEMVRLAKHWFKTLYFERYISGAKLMIELVAIHSAKKEIHCQKVPDYFRCFIDIIYRFLNLDHLNIVFGHRNQRKTRPRVLDPMNPYNNLGNNFEDDEKQLLMRYARETFRRILGELGTAMRIDTIFEPQGLSQ